MANMKVAVINASTALNYEAVKAALLVPQTQLYAICALEGSQSQAAELLTLQRTYLTR